LLVAGGEIMLRGAVGLATLIRLTPSVIGLTVVAAGTSVPELAVSMVAAREGKPDICVGNVIGSNIFNIAAIVGVCSLIRPMPITGKTIKLEFPVLALVTLMCLVIVQDGEVNRLDASLCIAVYICFTAYLVGLVRARVMAEEGRELREEVHELTGETPPRLWVCLIFLVIGIALLGLGAHTTVTGAVGVARRIGWSERLIGLTIVSVGTGLPELMASLVASWRGRSDLAIGNIIGSNLFNILGILGLSAIVAPLPVAPELISSDGWWMMGVTLLPAPVMFNRARVSRWEGAVFLAIYCVYIGQLLAEPI
jgi:cation:H+ antiporter